MAQAQQQADLSATEARVQPTGSLGNDYTWGNCTAYVASRVRVPDSMGNATDWSAGLLAAGWRTGAPRKGAIGVSHAGWAGHVVIVESVDLLNGSVTISEMNWEGLGLVDTRTTSVGDFEYFF